MESFLGIDVSKGYSDFALLGKDKQVLEEGFQLDDTRAGHDSLKGLLKKFIDKHQISQLYCGLESTGGFENNWYAALIEMGNAMPVKVARLNPSGVKRNMEAGLNRNITDALSAHYIAEYLIAQPDKIDYKGQDNSYAAFRSLHKGLMMQNKQKTQLINELKMNLYSSFPEMMRYCKQSVPGWVLELLKRYPTASGVSRLKPEKLARIKRVTLEKAGHIIAKAKTSVASSKNEAAAFVIQSLAEEILEKQNKIDKYKHFLETHCEGEEITLLQTIKGVGTFSAACIMIEIEEINRFPSPKHLVSYFGLHPELKDSGDKKKVAHISKKGRPAMRAVLYMCAMSAVLYDPHFKQVYHKHRNKGKNHYQAIGVVMHKLLRVVWGVLYTKQPYDAHVDQKNQAKCIKAQINKETEQTVKKRRFQEHDKAAPISSRQNKKRKAHLESQVGIAAQMRDHLNAPEQN
jgi:transposase